MKFDFAIACDWSAAVGRKPEPREDRCWIAWAKSGEVSEPEYCPTRLEAEASIVELLEAYSDARVLLGFDFAIGYPAADDGSSVLPTGRSLCAQIAELIEDDASGNNNRFQVAADLNTRIAAATGAPSGPFWGRPNELRLAALDPKRPSGTHVKKLRMCEVAARKQTKTKPKSPWQLTGAGSVGSQSLMGLPTVHRLLERFEDATLWPFEDPGRIVIGEIYPSLFEQRAPKYWYKDARQVVDSCRSLLELEIPDRIETDEGWIIGINETH